MHPEPTATPSAAPLPIRAGVLVLAGQQIRLTVKHGRLHASDTLGRESRSGDYARPACPFRRVVILGSGGYLSLDAVEWLADLKIPLIHLHPGGRLLLCSGHRGLDDARLRRAQAATTPTSPLGLQISRDLLRTKLDGQTQLLDRLPHGDDARAAIVVERDALDNAQTIDQLRLAEARAAAAYWQAWVGTQITFTSRDRDHVSPHWRTFSTRTSPITGTPRLAADPAGAILNYLYSLLGAEARLALLAVGLDPGLGVLHYDTANRDSLAADLMEPLRPVIDSYVLDLIASHVFTRRDFMETRRGQVRILPPLTHHLASTTTAWAQAVAPIAEQVAAQIAKDAGQRPQPTQHTGRNRRTASQRATQAIARPSTPKPPTRCANCACLIPTGRKRCPGCHAHENAARLRAQQVEEVARRLSSGEHPSQDPEVRARIARRQREHWQERQSSAAGGFTGRPSEFRRLILPRLAAVSPADLARRTGLSPGYCGRIRNGMRVPHVRHWGAFHLAGLRVADLPEGPSHWGRA